MQELLVASEKYESIETIANADAGDLKDRIRAIVEKAKSPTELFFYFTGHGYAYEDEFFYCASNFDTNRPNDSGLSTTDLHTLLRLANADLVIKVADACNSGTHLIKADMGLTPANRQGFKNLIQISSCLEAQSSLTGHPLSLFTERFRNAVLTKSEGVVYYTDVIASLRDQFIANDRQTPFFVSQYTGREQFVDDAHKLDKLRHKLKPTEIVTAVVDVEAPAPRGEPTIMELLAATESKLATADKVGVFVSKFFDRLKAETSSAAFSDYFQLDFVEHNDFVEPTAKRFIIEQLSRESRPDNFVTAEMSRKRRKLNPMWHAAATALSSMYDDHEYVEMYDLSLNCKLDRAQIRATFTPKYAALQRIVLVVTCAPSLERCYIFEVATLHALRDFAHFDEEGIKANQRWYKVDWDESADWVVNKICEALVLKVKTHIESTAKRLVPPAQ